MRTMNCVYYSVQMKLARQIINLLSVWPISFGPTVRFIMYAFERKKPLLTFFWKLMSWNLAYLLFGPWGTPEIGFRVSLDILLIFVYFLCLFLFIFVIIWWQIYCFPNFYCNSTTKSSSVIFWITKNKKTEQELIKKILIEFRFCLSIYTL